MPRTDDALFLSERLLELAMRAKKTRRAVFTPFLTPPEGLAACAAARKQGVEIVLFGGYEDAERQMAMFHTQGAPEEAFPIATVKVSWPRQKSPSHRDLLGSLLALGIQRQILGDIILLPERAFLFVQASMASYVADAWTQAGSVKLQTELAAELEAFEGAQGALKRDTVASLRLDAVVASGLNLPRTKAAEMIEGGRVKLRHIPTLRCDAHLEAGDMISVRGVGRLQLAEVGEPTRKGRLPILLKCFGISKPK